MSFSAVQLPDNKNQLFDLASADQATTANRLGDLRVRAGQQELDNNDQLRSLAPQLATGDRGAMATAATLGATGTGAVTSVIAANEAALKSGQANVGTLGHLGMALTTMDPGHQEAAYNMIAPGLQAQGFQVPDRYPGPDAIRGFASMALDPNKVFEAINGAPSTDPRGGWFGTGGGGGAPAGGGGGGAGGAPSGGLLSAPTLAPQAALSSVTDPQARDLIARAAAKQGLPPEAIPFWVAGLHNESGGSPRLNLQNGADGEIGPGQIMPATGTGMGYTPAQLRDPATNLEASAKYFNQQWRAANGDGVGALRGYNGGNPGNMKAQGYATAALGRMTTWGGGQQPAPAGQPAASVDAGPQPYVIGDSLAVGVKMHNAVDGGGIGGRNPAGVLADINALPQGALSGRPMILSTGASNDPGRDNGEALTATVQQQIAAARARGAGDIRILGVGERFGGVNATLQQIAQQAGATFVPVNAPMQGGDGVHPGPAGYRGLGLGGSQRPVQVASVSGTAGMPQTVTDAGGGMPVSGVQNPNPLLPVVMGASGTPAAPRGSDTRPLPVPPIPPPGGAPADLDDVVTIDRPGGDASLPAGTRYRVAGGPLQVKGGVGNAPLIENPNPLLPYAGASQPPEPNVLAALGLQPDAGPAAPGGPVQPAPVPAPGTTERAPLQHAANAPQAPSSAAITGAPSGQASAGGAMLGGVRQNDLLPAALPSFASGAGPNQQPVPAPGIPPGTQPLYVKGIPEKVDGKPGYMWGRAPDGSRVAMPIPGSPPRIKSQAIGGFMINTNEDTGQEVSRFAVPDARRPTKVESSEGTTLLDANGNKIGFIAKGSRDIDVQAYKEDREQAQQQAETGMQAQAQQGRLLEARSLLSQLPNTGADGDARAKWANFAETYMSPSFAAAFKAKLNLPNAVPAQEFGKLMTQNAGQQERGVMGARGGVQAMQLFMGANPGLNMRPEANRDLLNAMLVASQADQDYAAGHIAFVNQNGQSLRQGGAYQPASNFNQQWIAQRNPQVYAAAMSAVNGKPFADWSKNLRPEEMGRVGQILGRIDASTTVFGPDGKPHRVPAPPQQQGAQ